MGSGLDRVRCRRPPRSGDLAPPLQLTNCRWIKEYPHEHLRLTAAHRRVVRSRLAGRRSPRHGLDHDGTAVTGALAPVATFITYGVFRFAEAHVSPRTGWLLGYARPPKLITRLTATRSSTSCALPCSTRNALMSSSGPRSAFSASSLMPCPPDSYSGTTLRRSAGGAEPSAVAGDAPEGPRSGRRGSAWRWCCADVWLCGGRVLRAVALVWGAVANSFFPLQLTHCCGTSRGREPSFRATAHNRKRSFRF